MRRIRDLKGDDKIQERIDPATSPRKLKVAFFPCLELLSNTVKSGNIAASLTTSNHLENSGDAGLQPRFIGSHLRNGLLIEIAPPSQGIDLFLWDGDVPWFTGCALASAKSTALDSPEAAFQQSEQQSQVRQILAELPSRDAELLLGRADGLSYQELAILVGLHPASVGKLRARASENFRRR